MNFNFFACTENLDAYDFNTAFRIAYDQIGGPNGIFWYKGKPFTTLLDTKKEDLINEGFLDSYNEAVQKALVEFPNGFALEEGLTQIEVVLSDPPNIADLNLNEEEVVAVNYLGNNITSELPNEVNANIISDTNGEEIGGIWEALQELGSVVVEAIAGE